MKQLLIDSRPLQISPSSLQEGIKKTGNVMIEGILATAEIKNGNGRYYKRELWEREIDKYIEESITKNNSLGELDHPDSQIINLKNVSHIIKKIWWDGDNIMGKIEILPTHSGNIARALVESGVTIGISSRGMGSLKQNGDILEVDDDFSLLCWDLVSTPSNPNSWMKESKGLNESLNYSNYNPYQKVNTIITDILCSKGNCPIF
jgi:hypothetical protein